MALISDTELRLLTLLNVTATKRPKDQDIPGGHRFSPALTRSRDNSVLDTSEEKGKGVKRNGLPAIGEVENDESDKTLVNAVNGTTGRNENGSKRKKSVIFGGEVGPSGSQYVDKKKKAKKDLRIIPNVSVIKVTENHAGPSSAPTADNHKAGEELMVEDDSEDDSRKKDDSTEDSFYLHFATQPAHLTPEAISRADERKWQSSSSTLNGYGRISQSSLPAPSIASSSSISRISPSLLKPLKKVSSPLLSTALREVGSYRDMYLHSLDGEAEGSEKGMYGEQKESMRKAVIVHALNHVLKTRRKIIRNNEKLAHASSINQPLEETPRDQSFTRPKVLLLLPLRSLALHYLTTHLFPLILEGVQIENRSPFISSFSVPSGTTDPLTSTEAKKQYQIDHLVNFQGNSDDNFRFGIKITRKAWRIVMMPANEAKLMDCDILIASPLGMKMMSEKENSTDLMSSIEVCAVDGIDVMLMQNWDHVQFIFQNLNKIPESPHGCDFSRVKPWYLDSQAKYLRQTILISRYDTPEARSLMTQHCFNLSGRIRNEVGPYEGVVSRVRPGVKQIFERVDMDLKACEGPVEEVEKRLNFFIKKTIPALLKSAVSRQNTLIIIPSYFDFVRVTHYLRKSELLSYAAISEYSSNSEISRARTMFFKGKTPFLLMTERFHFYRRYRIRGAKTIVWYQPPEHAQFYSEILGTPFVKSQTVSGGKGGKSGVADGEDEVDVDEAEISSRVLWSRYDRLRLERVVGSENWKRMMSSEDGKAEFI